MYISLIIASNINNRNSKTSVHQQFKFNLTALTRPRYIAV